MTFSHEIKRRLLLGRKDMTNLDSLLKSRDIILPTKVYLVKAMILPVVMDGMWELDHKESWAPKNQRLWIMVLERTLESLLDSKDIKPVNPKGNQSWIFTGGTDAEAPILWPPDMKNWLIGKDPEPGNNGRQKEKGAAEDKRVRQHHQLNARKCEQTPGDGGGQRNLACCSPWDCKESDMT